MTARILSGKEFAARIKEDAGKKAALLREKYGVMPGLAVVYVSENGFIAGKAASLYSKENKQRNLVKVINNQGILTCVPQYIDLNSDLNSVTFYLRSNANYKDKKVVVKTEDKVILERAYKTINQAETIRLSIDLNGIDKNVEVDII